MIIISIVCMSACYQKRIENSFLTLSYTVLKEDQAEEYFECFMNNHALSMWFMHNCHQTVDDTLYFVALSSKEDTLYVYNYRSYQTKNILLNTTPNYPINFIYYHNHDSVFIFYNRRYTYNKTDRAFDFILINGSGNVINKYSLNDIQSLLTD